MKATKHAIDRYYQPTNDSCGYTALSILLSHYKHEVQPEQLLQDVPQAKPEDADAYGSITSQLATWCIGLGFNVELTTFDFLIIDLEWAKLESSEAVLARLEAVKDVRDIASLGKGWSKVYVKEYIKYLKAGGKLTIKPYVTADLLYEKLKIAPVYVNVSATPLYGRGRMKSVGLRQGEPDDVHGHVGTHSVVVYGNNEAGDFLIADPWFGDTIATADSLLCAITAAEIECDAMCFQINPATA